MNRHAPRSIGQYDENFDTQDKINRELKRQHRRDNRIETIAIIALLLGFGLLIGYSIWIGVSNQKQNNSLRVMNTQLTQLSMDVIQLFIDTTNITTVTTLQSGTFEWAISAPGSSDTNCFDSSMYRNDPQVTFNGTYQVQQITIGSVNFTLLIVSPPIEGPLVSVVAATSFQVCLIRFTPAVTTLDNIGYVGLDNKFTFTHANANKFTASPDCLAAQTCYISANEPEGYPVRDSYRVGFKNGPDPEIGDGYISYYYNRLEFTGNFPNPTSVNINDALRLMFFFS